ncbi:hypothetical protein [Nocardia wallacei]|uniref:hypothetical protein n=1 Tax=Nocardia wallacei TaxID=480035 RepID=UPI0024544FFF|nr:hypothetical protein [Nocardia wallacei]
MSTPRLFHYRAEPLAFDRARIYTQRKPGSHTKPVGFWVSVQGEDDWPSWCRDNEYSVNALSVAHEVRLSGSAAIRLITSVAEIDEFHDEFAEATDFDLRCGYGRDHWGIGWDRVIRRYDGIIIAPYLWERRLGTKCGWYYTWDCASGCIWNLDAIESVAVVEVVQS